MAKTIKNLLVNHIFETNFKYYVKKYISGKTIDIGCGTKPYKDLLAPYVTEHIGVDYEETFHDKSNIDLFGTAYSIPAKESSFDSAICTAVLEHLSEPEEALRESFRLLKKGAYAIYSVPFIWHLHEEPNDYFRYTKYGLKHIFEKSGFQIIEINPLSGFWVTFGQLFVYYIYRFNRGFLKYIPVIPFIGLCIQLFSYFLDKIDKTERWTWMYIIVAKK